MPQEKLIVLIFLHVFILPGVGLAIALLCGHGADLIAGYNTAKPAEKAKWNKKALCRGVGVLLLAMLVCIELFCLGGVFGVTPLMWIGGALLVVVTALGLIWINKSKRFKKQD